MRTTLTLDEDVGQRLKDAAHREQKPFRTIVNEALRMGLGLREKPVTRSPSFTPQTFRSAFKGGVDEGRLNQVVDQLEAEAFGGTSGPSGSDSNA